jgi:predicted lipoprotein
MSKAVLWGVVALVLVAMALDTTYREPGEATAAGGKAFDRDRYGRETFAPKVVPALEKDAVDITTLMDALGEDEAAASQRYGKREGNASYSFPVRGEGVAGKPEDGQLPVKVDGLEGTSVAIQIGPAVNGTALRDATGLIQFGQFVNQVEFADAAIALNNEVKASVLSKLDLDAIAGKKVTFLGAFTLVVPSKVVVTPVRLEVRE